MWLRDKKCAFEAPEFSKLPVKFPVSREFGQRKVSARLPAPPSSPRLGEIRANSPLNFAELAITTSISLKTKLERRPPDFNRPAFYALFSGRDRGGLVFTS